MTRVSIIGPGAIGSIVAAWLYRAPALDVTVCARTPFDRLRVETPDGSFDASPRVLTDPAQASAADWVLVCTKAYDAAGAAAWLARLVGPSTRVAVLQNGVEHVERFARFVPRERIVPAVVDIPAERIAPGHVRQRRYGSLLVPEGAAGADFVELFRGTPIAASTTANLKTAAWRKLALNSAGAVDALVLKPSGIVQNDAVAQIMRGIIDECIAVARAEGAGLEHALADELIAGFRSGPGDSINSLHADRLAGRPMEIDARNGAIVRAGRRHGIATPLNDLLVTLLQAAEARP